MASTTSKPRHNLTLQPALQRKLKEIAAKQGTSTADLLRTCVKIGLMVLEVENTPGAELIIRENGAERKILIV
ncbi:hypothetical protein [Longimicrobium sp.]|uniref:hypothetical protein n=1 Tax=Longimicrobium sp. TaxID=2029185 RepID=UPI002C0A9DD3|nr:hypothetical protein [Longimicrobium sp.]HSU14935.1 hypothetical protein [Longimicrobium sp.]